MPDREKLSVFVIACNRAALLRTCLAALGFADELIVVDKTSTDDSAAVAARFADRVITVPWSPTVEETRGFALSQCTHDWVLCLDDDECLSPEIVLFIDAELRAPRADIYTLPLRHYILGRHDPRAYYAPERHPRLFRRGAVAFTGTVHGGTVLLSDRRFDVPDDTGACIHHLSHHDVTEWIAKTNRYTSRPDRLRPEHEGDDLIDFAHARIDHWAGQGEAGGEVRRTGPGDYPAAVALLRAVYDLVDRLKSWEEQAGPGGSVLFPRLGRRLEAAYAARLGHLRRTDRRRERVAATTDAGDEAGELRRRQVVETLAASLRTERAARAAAEAALAASMNARQAEAVDAAAARDALGAALRTIEASTIWRLTAPARRTADRFPLLTRQGRAARRRAACVTAADVPAAYVPASASIASDSVAAAPPTGGVDPVVHRACAPPSALPSFAMAVAPTVSVIVPTFGGVNDTLRCLAAIARHKPATPIEILLIDDASPDPEVALLAEISGVRLITHPDNLGYLRTCNAAARLARGEFLLFLNNDTEVFENWLDPMVGILRGRAEAGAVGAKLLFPDGRLQEAGGIVWADGTGWTYGRGDDPDRPDYNFVREVDYVSGAALLVRRALFDRLGGFDERFAPAYCEDSDLAFRIRAAGSIVLYQPLARVTHREGGSHGTDPKVGIRRFNDINQRKLLAKWADVLAAKHFPHGTNVLRASEHARGRPVLLVVADRLANAARLGPMLPTLARAGTVVKLWSVDAAGDGAALRQAGIDVRSGGIPALRDWIGANGAALDRALLLPGDAMAAVLPDLRLAGIARIVYLAVDEAGAGERSLWRRVDIVLHPAAEAARQALLLEPAAEHHTISLAPDPAGVDWPASAWRAVLELPAHGETAAGLARAA